MMNEYDQTKRMLNKIRNLNNTTKNLREQVDNNQDTIDSENPMENPPALRGDSEQTDVNVINNVDVQIHSNDESDLQIKDDEKGNISQLIDDFRSDVSEIVDFGKLDIYDESAKLNGKLKGVGIQFVLSAGDDNGFYLNNTSLLKIDDTSIDLINKLKVFQQKFSSIMNDIIVARKEF